MVIGSTLRTFVFCFRLQSDKCVPNDSLGNEKDLFLLKMGKLKGRDLPRIINQTLKHFLMGQLELRFLKS